MVGLLISKADRSSDRAEGEAFWHCFFQRFDNIRILLSSNYTLTPFRGEAQKLHWAVNFANFMMTF